MQIVWAPRASAILYNLLKGQDISKPWLLPANICPIVPITFFKAGIPFEFVDISAETLHIDLEQVDERLKRGAYGGVLYAHTYGDLSTPVEFFQHVKSRYPDLLLVDDRCLCIPDLELPEEMSADVALYSTGYAKIVDLGIGGYAFLKTGTVYAEEILPFDPKTYENLEKDYKQAIRNRQPYTYKDGDWLQTDADLLAWYDYRHQIEEGLKSTLQHKSAINEIYTDRLPWEWQYPAQYQTWRFNLRIKNRDRVLGAIFASGTFASTHYASLAGIMAPGQCPQAESLADNVLNLFNDHHFNVQQAEQVCTILMEKIL